MNKKFINLYVVDNSEQFTSHLEEIFYEFRSLGINVIGKSIKNRACMEDIKNTRLADVFLIAATLPDKSGIELISYLRKNVNPNAKFIVTVTSNTRNLVDQAILAGADDFLQKPFDPEKLIEIIFGYFGKTYIPEEHMAQDDELEETDEFGEETDDDDNELNIYEPEVEQKEDVNSIFEHKNDFMKDGKSNRNRDASEIFRTPQYGKNYYGSAAYSEKPNKVITFTAPKSSGKTTTLVNVAAAIKNYSEYDPKIIIVDLNVVYPSVQYALHHRHLRLAKKNIYDLMEDIYELDKELLEQAVIVHEPTGIHILDTPFQSIRDFNQITKEKIQQLIVFLREEYDVILIDTSGNIRDNATMIPLSLSDTNILLFQSDFTSLVQTRKFIEMVHVFEEKADKRILDKTMLILNRYDVSNNLSIEKAKNTILHIDGIDLKIPLYIPEEPEMTKYTNRGEFIVDKQGPASSKLIELAGLIYPFYKDGDMKFKNNHKESNSFFLSILNKFKK